MSDLEFSQDEQEQKVKEWWNNNRNSIFGGIAIGLAGVWGWNSYQDSQVEKSKEAAAEYALLLNGSADATSADAVVERLKTDFPKTAYTSLAEMSRASQVLPENVDSAIAQLTDAVENAPDEGFKQIASIRLARVLVDDGRLDEAKPIIDSLDYESSFASHSFEIKGDYLLKKGDTGAREAYESALSNLESTGLEGNTANLLERKLQFLK